MEQKSATGKARAKSGPGCERCHSPASEWLNIHNNYGGPNVKRDTETPEHRAERLAQSAENGHDSIERPIRDHRELYVMPRFESLRSRRRYAGENVGSGPSAQN